MQDAWIGQLARKSLRSTGPLDPLASLIGGVRRRRPAGDVPSFVPAAHHRSHAIQTTIGPLQLGSWNGRQWVAGAPRISRHATAIASNSLGARTDLIFG